MIIQLTAELYVPPDGADVPTVSIKIGHYTVAVVPVTGYWCSRAYAIPNLSEISREEIVTETVAQWLIRLDTALHTVEEGQLT